MKKYLLFHSHLLGYKNLHLLILKKLILRIEPLLC